MRVPLTIARKRWEQAYILQALYARGMLRPGVRGLGFGVGSDPMIPVMVNYGCNLVATDYGENESQGWGSGLELNPRGIADANAMERQVRYRDVDMNDIPADLSGFDFVYSCGSLEHIGGLQEGLDFIENAMACLRPGGLAVHTTELNLSGATETVDTPELSLYLPRQIDDLVVRLNEAGHRSPPVNYHPGSRSEDTHIAVPPFEPPCLKWEIRGFEVTSLGLVARARVSERSLRDRVGQPQTTMMMMMMMADLSTDVVGAVTRRSNAYLLRLSAAALSATSDRPRKQRP